ncbi:hypothetical protein BAUCODRAFT_382967 [Baudoinia panamericana UAMH 10762]|uniref:Uncharacterized protein n=1 Tax=Baudoinia panamericana (strain UAMH 10762) TaxID=717646 RepID=M2N4G4_BAUPA|nr:uncharacterized protein BAUCODRAFT_382967 [Baudoinia panamericana UAMH 10762]EMC98878.1 hypothetical protein BAUCODRAFT_382967 [Baudoinia panamericana UAMH 10762]
MDTPANRKRPADCPGSGAVSGVIDLTNEGDPQTPTLLVPLAKQPRVDSVTVTEQSPKRFSATPPATLPPAALASGISPSTDAPWPIVPSTPLSRRSVEGDRIEESLHKIPELAKRYVPATLMPDGTLYISPKKFSVKPPYWQRWTGQMYECFGEYLRSQIDLKPFAQANKLPLEEVMHVFTSLVVNPMRDAKEATKRGEEGMQEIIDMANKYGTRSRRWGRPISSTDPRRLTGELTHVEKGAVVLNCTNGNKRRVKVDDLVEEDIEYLRKVLLKGHWQLLWHEHAADESVRAQEAEGSIADMS